MQQSKIVEILSTDELRRTVNRLASQIVEASDDLSNVVLLGVYTRGVPLSVAITKQIHTLEGVLVPSGALDITFYRDDVRTEIHLSNKTEIPFSIDGKKVILIDDVLYTGRTIRAALDALQDFGRPKKVELCVLINRRFDRELPIQPDYCGKTIDGQFNEKVKVDKEKGEVVIY